MSEADISPLARRLAEENNVDWRVLQGSGAGGKVVERDVLEFLARVMAGEEELDPTPEPVPDGMDAWPEDDIRSFQQELRASRKSVGLEDIQKELSAADRFGGADLDGAAVPDGRDAAGAPDVAQPAAADDDAFRGAISEDIFLFDDEDENDLVAGRASASEVPAPATPGDEPDDLDEDLLIAGDDGASTDVAYARSGTDAGDDAGGAAFAARSVPERAVPLRAEGLPDVFGEAQPPAPAYGYGERDDIFGSTAGEEASRAAPHLEPEREEQADLEPAYREPAYREPAYREPAYREPAYGEPMGGEPTYEEPAYEGPAHAESSDEGLDLAGRNPSDLDEAGLDEAGPDEAGMDEGGLDDGVLDGAGPGDGGLDDGRLAEPAREERVASGRFGAPAELEGSDLEAADRELPDLDVPDLDDLGDLGLEDDARSEEAFEAPLGSGKREPDEGSWTARGGGDREGEEPETFDVEALPTAAQEDPSAADEATAAELGHSEREWDEAIRDASLRLEAEEGAALEPAEADWREEATGSAGGGIAPDDADDALPPEPREGSLPLVTHGTLLRRHVDLTALAGAQLVVSQELGHEEPLSPTVFLLRAAAKAASDADWDGDVALADLHGDGARAHRVSDAAERPFRDLLTAIRGSEPRALEAGVALVVADMSELGIDEAVLHIGPPVLTLGRILYDNQRGSYRSTLALSGDVAPERGAALLTRVAELLDAPVRLVL